MRSTNGMCQRALRVSGVITAAATVLFVLMGARAFAQGTQLTNGADATGAIASAGQTQTWTFEASQGDAIVLSVADSAAKADWGPFAVLRAPNAGNLGTFGGPDAGQIRLTATQTGTYTVEVGASPTAPAQTGPYILRLAKAPGSFSVPAGDQGGSVTNGENHTGAISMGDLDLWSFQAQAGDALCLTVADQTAGSVPVLGPFIQVWAPSGASQAAGDLGLATQVCFTAPLGESGTYSVLISANSNAPASTGDYTVRLVRVPAPFLVPAGDEGGELTNGQTYPGVIVRGDLDPWRFYARAGDAVSLTLTTVSGGTPWMRVYGPQGGANLAFTGSGTVQQLNLIAAQDGIYTVLISASGNVPASTLDYTLLATGVRPLPPSITVHPPAAVTVLTGTTVFWSSVATGSAMTVQWQVSTNGGSSWTNIVGATSVNLSFAAVRFDNGKLYRAVYTNVSGFAVTTAVALTVRLRVRSDMDNPQDRKSDLVIWRPGSATWFWLTTSSSFNYAAQGQRQWGNSALGDIPITADMDGDGITDLVVWRPSDGTFYWLTSSTGYAYANQQQKQWGNSALGDKPFVGDIDGDGKGDLIVWRPGSGTWFYLLSSTGYSYAAQGQRQWGNSALGDRPIIADIDGDGLVDFTVWRASTGTWFWLKSTANYDVNQQRQVQWGNNALGDIPMVADLDGDGASDIVIWRPSDSTFYWLTSLSGFNQAAPGVRAWGSSAQNDVPMLGDIDGDGAAELIVWRPATGTWFWLTASGGYSYAGQQQMQWGSGAQNDIPMMRGGIY